LSGSTMHRIFALALLAATALSPLPTFAQDHPLKGVALVIGESDYATLQKLDNPKRDARAMDDMLDSQMKKWVNEPAFNKVDRGNKKLVLSQLFEWFADDFGGRNALPAYISKYAEGGSVDGFTVEFSEFDWSLNK